ncbi:MAG: hypothetical protein M1383_02385 [Patescibacteria group bacterium]|nr:hypothetical protein [Patescibacteria group bacterium]
MPQTFEVIMDGSRLVFKEIARLKGKLHQGHTADGLYFRCCDFRFWDRFLAFLKFLFNGRFDIFAWPGGLTMLLLGQEYGHPDMREATFYWIEKMLALHHTNRVFMEMHGKHKGRCGAYASTESLAGKSDDELFRLQLQHHLRMKRMLEERFAGVEGFKAVIIYDEAVEQTDEFVFSNLENNKPLSKAA